MGEGKGGGDTTVLFCNHPPLNPLPSREGKDRCKKKILDMLIQTHLGVFIFCHPELGSGSQEHIY